MTSERDLYPEDRAELWSVVDPIIASFDAAGDPNLQRIAAAAIAALEALAADGHVWAERPLRVCAISGMRGLIGKRLHADRGTVRIAHTGAVISLPARMGIEVKNPKPPPPREYQQRLWWEMTWGEFDEFVRSLQAQRDRLSGEITGFQEIQRLHEQFPETQTPGEACALKGIDPRKFDMGGNGGGSDGTGTDG